MRGRFGRGRWGRLRSDGASRGAGREARWGGGRTVRRLWATRPAVPATIGGVRDDRPDDAELPEFLDPHARPWPLPLRVLAGVTGSLFLMVGFLGVVLPVLPGVPFLIVAAFLLGRSSPDLRRWVNDLDRRCPLWLRRAVRWRRGRPVLVARSAEDGREQ